jgi:tRNA(Ile)-lysidine synthase
MPPPRGLLQQLDQDLHRTGLIRPRQRLLVACSGGPDSVALLRLLEQLNRSDYWRLDLIVAHINHQIRGPICDADAAFTEQLAYRLGIPFVCQMLSLPKSGRGVISEATSRKARFEAFAVMAQEHRADAIVLAHQADDQAETLIMRMLRGTGLSGLRGIAPRQRLGQLTLLRPLLAFSRQTLRDYLQSLGQSFCDDHTNAAPEFLRNQVRHKLLPLMEELQPQVRRSLLRLSQQARDAHRTLKRETRGLYRAAVQAMPGQTIHILRAPAQKASLAAVGLLLRELLASGDHLNFDQVRSAARAIRRGPVGKSLQLGGGAIIKIHRQTAEIFRLQPSFYAGGILH